MSELPQLRPRADKHLHRPAPDTPGSTCRCSTATLSSPAGDILVLRVAGEVDSQSFAVLDAALDDVLERRPDQLIVDLTGLVFCSARGLAAITNTTRAAADSGVRCSVSGASPVIARLWPHHWPDGDAPRIHRTTAAAVLFAVALQAESWSPARPGGAGRRDPVADGPVPGRGPVDLPEGAGRTDRPDPADGRSPLPRTDEADPAAMRRALHRHRSAMYRSALQALGASYGAPPLAPELDAQLRIALAGFAGAPSAPEPAGPAGAAPSYGQDGDRP